MAGAVMNQGSYFMGGSVQGIIGVHYRTSLPPPSPKKFCYRGQDFSGRGMPEMLIVKLSIPAPAGQGPPRREKFYAFSLPPGRGEFSG